MSKDPQPENAHRRTGFVARLPKAVRDEINRLIQDGLTYTQILQKLGDPVRDITEDHLSTWRTGGYMDWLRQQQRVDILHANHEMAIDLVKVGAATTLHDAGRQVVASQLCQLLADFDPTALLQHLQDNPQLYMRVINALARLSEGELACGNQRLHETALKAKLARDQAAESPNVVTNDGLKEAQQKLHLH